MKKNIGNKRFLRCSIVRTTMNLFFLFVFAVIFFFQQFSAFSSLNNAIGFEKSFSECFKTSHSSGIHFSAPHTHESSIAISEMELAEDEDKQRSELDFHSDLVTNNAVEELAYNSILRIRYLQLAFSLRGKPNVDFYILYHSWKIHLIWFTSTFWHRCFRLISRSLQWLYIGVPVGNPSFPFQNQSRI